MTLCADSCGHITTLPKNDNTKLLLTTAAQQLLTAKITLVAIAGVDPAVSQSGKHEAKSNPTTKRGSPHLRKTRYQIVCTYLKKSPPEEAVYQFIDKKRSEGKPYFVYMTAGANKFLRIYYARVKESMAALDDTATPLD